VSERVSGPSDAVLWARRTLLLFGGVAAFVAVQAGLARVGFSFGWAQQAHLHGPLFVVGLFGTVISLERAVALGHPVALVVPSAFVVASGLLLVRPEVAAWVALGGAAGLVLANLAIVRKQSVPFTWVMLGGSVLLALGTMSWAAGQPVSKVAVAWMGFFVLTIVAERLELSRLVPTPDWARTLVLVLSVVDGTASGVGLLGVEGSAQVAGLSMILLGLWALRFDLARRTIRQAGLPKYTATGVLLGAGWLLVTGVTLAVVEVPPAGPRYDAALHALFVGYVLSMVFAHAPLILPSVTRIALPMHGVLFVPMVVLQVGLVMRLVGDFTDHLSLRQLGALLNVVALPLFIVCVLISRARRLTST